MEQPAADFDGAWKYALEQFFAPFLELFFPTAHADIDWQQPITFRDTELQQIAPEDQAGKQRVDKLVQVWHHDGTPGLVLVHVEIQSQRDVDFAERMFRYHARLFDRDRIPVVSLAVLGDDDLDWHPDRFGYTRWGCHLLLHFPTVKLRALDPRVLAAKPNPVAVLTLLHRDAQETRGQPFERLRRKVARYRALLQQGYTASEVRNLLRLMEHVLRLDPVLARQAFDQMRQVEKEVYGMETFVTSFEEIGWEAGHAEGLVEGELKGQRDLVLYQLERKVGTLSKEIQTQITVLTAEQLRHLSAALLDFTSVADLTTWLEQQATPPSV